MTRLRLLPVEVFGDSEDRKSIVLVPPDLRAEFPPRSDPEYPGKDLWPDLLVSPSQLATYRECGRKWGWNKLDGIKEPEKPSQRKGKEYHKGLEDWLQKSEVPGKELDRLLTALSHFPEPGSPGLEVERYFALLVDDVVFHGYTDVDVNSSFSLEVYDLKTTKDFMWAKSTEQLGQDPQCSIYALKQMVEAGLTNCDTRWVYCLTEGRRESMPVDKSWTFDEALSVVTGWLPVAKTLRDTYKASKKAIELPFNVSQCSAYGGCYYQDRCNISARDRMKAMFVQDRLKDQKKEERRDTMAALTLKEKMAQDLANRGKAVPPSAGVVAVQKTAPTNTPPATVQATKTTSTPPVAGKKPSLAEISRAMKEGKLLKETAEAPVAAGEVVLAKGLNPPDAAPDPRNAEEVVVEEVEAAPETTPPAVEAAKPAPKKAKAKKEETITPSSGNVFQDLGLPNAEALQAEAGFGFTLLIDALPEKGPRTRRAEELIASERTELEEKAKVASYLLIDFNKGPAMLAAALKDSFKRKKPHGVFAVDSRAVDAAVLNVLAEFADNIVRGVR